MNTTIGANINALRLSLRLTQKQLCDAVGGLDQSQLSRIELNKHNPSLPTLATIARALNVSAAELLRGI